MKPQHPVMAALLAASSAAFLPGTSRAMVAAAKCVDQVKTGDATMDAALQKLDDAVVRGRIACVLQNDPRTKADVADRMYDFLMTPAGGKSFVEEHLRSDAASKKVRDALRAEAHKWADKATVDDLSAVYYLAGTGDKTPPWVAALKVDGAMKQRDACLGQLSVALDDWTKPANQLVGTKAVDHVSAFLQDAAIKAHGVLADQRCIDEIKASIAQNNTTPAAPPTTGAGPATFSSPAAGFDFNSLYVNGAIVQNVSAAGDSGYRTISMKVYTMPGDKPTDPPKMMVGIVDITDPTAPYAPKLIPISGLQAGTQDFTLKDGGRSYTLTVSGTGANRQIVLSRKGSKDGDGNVPLSTRFSDLVMARADQAAQAGTVTVDGHKYYVMGQGGTFGGVLFFPKDAIDQRAQIAGLDEPAKTEALLRLQAEAVGAVTKVDPGSGGTVSAGGHPDLGNLAGSPHHLEWDPNLQMWKVAAGAGDPPPTATPPPAPAAAPGPAAPGSPSGPSTPAAGADQTLDDVVARFGQNGFTTSDSQGDLNAGLDDATKAKIRIVTDNNADAPQYYVLYAPSLGVKDPDNARGWTKGALLRVWGAAGGYIVEDAQDTNGGRLIQYVSPEQLADNKGALSGSYSFTGKAMQGVTDPAVAAHILKNYMGAGDEEVSAVVARAQKRGAGPGKGTISGPVDNVIIHIQRKGYQLWPGDKLLNSENTGSNAGLAGLVGPGTAANMAGGTETGFPPKQDAAAGRQWKLAEPARKDIALYQSQEDQVRDGKTTVVNVWGLMISYKNASGAPVRTGKVIPVFGSGNDRRALPTSYDMAGLEGVQLPDSATLSMAMNSNKARGAICAYRYAVPAADGSNVRDKPDNSAGPVFWWPKGSDAAAKSACASGKF